MRRKSTGKGHKSRSRGPSAKVRRRVSAGMSYSLWIGECLEVAAGHNPKLTDEEKERLLRKCPQSMREQGEIFLETVPMVADAMAKLDDC